MFCETFRRRPASAIRIVPQAPRSAADVQNEREWEVRKQASLIGCRKRRNEYLRANGLQPLQPVTISTPAAPAAPPDACRDCGAAIEAGQGICRYCLMQGARGDN